MLFRRLGRTGLHVSELSYGAARGATPDPASFIATVHAAIDGGVNFIDTADVYGDGRSEKIVARVVADRSEQVYVATKMGRRLNPHVAEGYNRENLTGFVERNLTNLSVDALDLVQLHCPPTEVYYHPEVFGVLDDLVAAGKVRHYGVSVEKVEEAIKAAEYENLASVQIVFNMFRQRPADLFFKLAHDRNIAILARVPLASGLLTGKMSILSTFSDDDHRSFNREGAAFDRGETFAGVNFETGLTVVEEFRRLKPAEATMAQFALRWILQFDAVSVAIPGAKNAEQATANAAASDIAPLDWKTLDSIRTIYNEYVRPEVHHRW